MFDLGLDIDGELGLRHVGGYGVLGDVRFPSYHWYVTGSYGSPVTPQPATASHIKRPTDTSDGGIGLPVGHDLRSAGKRGIAAVMQSAAGNCEGADCSVGSNRTVGSQQV